MTNNTKNLTLVSRRGTKLTLAQFAQRYNTSPSKRSDEANQEVMEPLYTRVMKAKRYQREAQKRLAEQFKFESEQILANWEVVS